MWPNALRWMSPARAKLRKRPSRTLQKPWSFISSLRSLQSTTNYPKQRIFERLVWEKYMPSTIQELLDAAGIELADQVKWRTMISDDKPGIYIVSISSAADKNEEYSLSKPPIDSNIVTVWLNTVSTLKLDGSRPTMERLVSRLSGFWLPDETILYIGKADTSLRSRVGAYYRTRLGKSGPHRGGHWLKTLSVLDELSVFWSTPLIQDGESMEKIQDDLLSVFVTNVSQATKKEIYDPQRLFSKVSCVKDDVPSDEC